MLFADFSKGFDLIDHNILNAELEKLEVSQVLLSWITAFLVGKEDKQYELKVPHLSRRM
jgi:hypothetical protein